MSKDGLLRWNNTGVEPDDTKKTAGWIVGEQPPADYLNWIINQTVTGITNAGKTDQYYLTSSSTGNIGALVLDGVDDYATLPAIVGQLTNGTSTFELVIKNKLTVAGDLMCKKDTSYSSTSNVKGWRFIPALTGWILGGSAANGTAETTITGTTQFVAGMVYYAKITFDGTTVTLYSSSDGINWFSEATSTNANLIGGLSISDNVLTQVGRRWTGSGGYGVYLNGTIYSIQLTKSGILTNRYEFKNAGANQTISDTVGTAHGVSAGGAVQGVSGTNYTRNTSGKYTALTDNMRFMMEADVTAVTSIQPTLALDSLSAKPIIGTDIVVGRVYDVRYKSAIDSYVAVTQEEKLVGGKPFVLSQAATSFTISGLDINRDGGMYEMIIDNLTTSASATISMYVNGDVTAANYKATNYVYASSYAQTVVTDDASIIRTTVGSGVINMADITLIKSGSYIQANGQTSPLSSGSGAIIGSWSKTATVTNITSITFTASTGNINTATVKIYKR